VRFFFDVGWAVQQPLIDLRMPHFSLGELTGRAATHSFDLFKQRQPYDIRR